jgi:hypothetical protein
VIDYDSYYDSFVQDIDYDRLYEAIEFEPMRQDSDGNDIGQCPDLFGLHKHGDRTGKFIFYRESGLVSCFVCGATSLLKFTCSYFDWTNEESVRWLAQFADVMEQDDEAFLNEIDDILRERKPTKSTTPRFSEAILDRWTSWSDWPDIAYEWAETKGVDERVATDFSLRYGRVRTMTDSKEPWVGQAIIIPHFWRGKLVGWQQRWLDEERPEGVGKYKSTNDMPRFDTLFNLDRCVRETVPILVVESPGTVLWLHACDLPSVATFGGTVTPDQMKLMRQFQQGVVIAPDNDGPGRKYLKKISEYLEPFVPVYTVAPVGKFDSGADLGDLAPDVAKVDKHLSTMSLL